MKILQVNVVYKKGSTGKITYDIHKGLLQNDIESVVCYGRGETIKDLNVYKVCCEPYSKLNNMLSRITGVMYGGCYFSTKKLISIIKNENPDIVHLQCINGYFVNIYKLVTWLKNNNVKTVLTLHAEFMYTGGCGHSFDCNQWRNPNGCGYSQHCPRYKLETKSFFLDGTKRMWSKMNAAFDGFNDNLIVTSVSPWLMERAEESAMLSGKKHAVVLNGLDTRIFYEYGEETKKKMLEELGIIDKKVVFHATPSFSNSKDHIKGGYYVIELAKRMPELIFVVAGPYYEVKSIPENMIMLGKVSDQKKLAQLYSMADVTLLTSKRETFSMVTAESLCCGTPVVGFCAGAPEMIALKEYSEFVDYGDIDALVVVVKNRLSCSKRISKDSTYIYSLENMKSAYIRLYKELNNEHKEI